MTQLANSAAARDIRYQIHSQTNIRQHEKDGPLIITRGEGAYIYDDSGNRYLDAMSGLWCVALGYSDTSIKEAVKAQIEKILGRKITNEAYLTYCTREDYEQQAGLRM